MVSEKRKICVITNTRADYSRLRTVLFALRERDDVELSICVAGSHLLSAYGNTIDEIRRDGFDVAYRIYTEVEGRVLSTMTKSTGLAIIEFSSYLENQRPDMVVVHGDRFEALAAAIAASMMNIHVAHIQGGEITGTIDEHIRHAITKLSHFHFASDEPSAQRIRGLGEDPEQVFSPGCPSTDVLLSAPSYTFDELKAALDPKIKKREWLENLTPDFVLLIHHPVTTEYDTSNQEIEAIAEALRDVEFPILALWPNIDAGSEQIVQAIKKFERDIDGRFAVINTLPMETFVNALRHARLLIGNSSAGVREACYFGTPVVNVGTRQQGRVRTSNVRDVPGDVGAIREALQEQLKRKERYAPEYPYGRGNSGAKIAEKLATIPLGSPQKRLRSDI